MKICKYVMSLHIFFGLDNGEYLTIAGIFFLVDDCIICFIKPYPFVVKKNTSSACDKL
jgi:hypothetical protein